jgi:hypothetical protein
MLSSDAEQILTELVPRYLAARQRLRLREALLTYWAAEESITGFDIAAYAASVETLKHAWFKSGKSPSEGEHMPEQRYLTALADVLPQIQKSLTDIGAPLGVVHRIEGAFRMGVGEQLDTFLSEINLAIGTAERHAIRARNKPSHGGLGFGQRELRDLTRHGNAYRVLFARIFLKLLEYDGQYVDRTSVGYPSRHISEPAAGSLK